jgi:hyaluronoglucosaminidase
MRLARIPLTIATAMIAVAAFVMVAPAASASPYPAGCTIQISKVTAVPGDQLTVTASGYPAGAVVTFTLHSTPVVLGSATATAGGVATLVFTLPAGTVPGLHTITANGVPSGECDPLVSADLQVDAASVVSPTTAAATTGTLPRTGTNSAELIQLALVLIAVGGLITLATRKRLHRARVES